MTVRLVSGVVLGLLLGLCLGCGAENPLGRQAVSGTVTLGGEPVAKGSIQFIPRGGASTTGGGNIVDGKYTISVEGGLAPGEYGVTIHVPDPAWDPQKSLVAKELAPKEWTKGTQTVKVSDAQANTFDFDMKN